MRTPPQLAAIVALTLGLGGCNSPTVADKNTVETFSGTVQPSAVDAMKTFNVGSTGEVIATLDALTPGGSALIGIWFGQPNGGVCSVSVPIAADGTKVGTQLFDYPVQIRGAYCIQVADYALYSGGSPLTTAQTYTIRVSHP